MFADWIEKVTGSFEDKRRYRRYRAQVEQLPADYRSAVEALSVTSCITEVLLRATAF